MNREHYLQAMGIDIWKLRRAKKPELKSDWEELFFAVKNCKMCDLHQTRNQIVFGSGNQGSSLLFIGEAPGANEDAEGEPFVGRAGQLLNSMLASVGLSRQQVYIANILKCRPPNNRDPKPEETACCTPYLLKQIELLQPTLIVALGRIAAQFLLKTTASLSALREKDHQFQSTKLMVTFHPAYLLRNPIDKRKAWQDMSRIKKEIS